MKESLNLNNQIVIYQSKDGKIQLDVKLENETVWLNRQQLSELFGRDIKTIGKHINNALKEELDDTISTVAKFATVQNDDYCYQELHEIRISEDYSRINNEETIYMHR